MDRDLNLLAKSNPEKTIREHTDDLLDALEVLCQHGYITDEKAYHLCKIACEYHDHGKINADFQERIRTKKKFDVGREIPHHILSAYLVEKQLFDHEDDYIIVLNAVLNHHHYTDNIHFLQENKREIAAKLNGWNYSKIGNRVMEQIFDLKQTPLAILVQGVLLKCDYCASAGIQSEFPNDFLEQRLVTLFESWKAHNPHAAPNALQRFCKEHQGENLIITAPTGMGKTEASLFWLGNRKGFYVLPLKTAINSMYLRICDSILNGEHIKNRVALLHSDALSVVLNHSTIEEFDLFDYAQLGKRFSLPLTICTPDQLFDFVFKYKGYELKLAILSYSHIIIDEIQAYNAELLSYIIYGLHQILKMGGKVALFTATLPPYILHLLEQPYGEKSPFQKADFSMEQQSLRHNVRVCSKELEATDIVAHYQLLEGCDSRKLLVVCNTVKKAQQVYADLVTALGEEQVCLLHAKFVKNDRRTKEEAILQDGDSAVKKSVIWVSTQIVEASLDIDFDVIFTELSELSGLFQRLGRCNRKGLKPVTDYNCFVFTKINPRLLISQYNSNMGFIDGDLYLLSEQVLQAVDGILSEEQKIALLERVFTFDNLKDSVFFKEYQKKYKYVSELFVDDYDATEIDKRFRRIISKTVLPHTIYVQHQEEIQAALAVLTDKTLPYPQAIQQKQRAKDVIDGFCVSVAPYEVKGLVIKTLQLNKFTSIDVVECRYDEWMGFQKANIPNPKEEDTTGLFF